MKRKSAKKQTSPKQPKEKSASYFFIHITAVSFVLLIVVLVSVLTYRAIIQPSVLGMSTNASFIADQGGDRPEGGSNSGEQPPQPPPQQELQDGASPEEPNEIPRMGQQHGFNVGERPRPDDIKIGSNSARGFLLKSGSIEAHTRFPLSVDPTTNAIKVTTPAGTKELTVLPDQAVQNLLQHQILSSVHSSSGSGEVNSPVTLTQLNNQPAFAVQGVSNKKLLGIFPVSLDKTVFVSAQTGSVLQTQESFFNKLLEKISF